MAAKKQFFLNLFLVFQFVLCSSLDSLFMNQTFRDGDVLISRGKSFVFGFFSPGKSSNRYLGIWYYKVSEQSVAWVLNRDNPVSGSLGFLEMNPYGNLVLYNDPNKKIPLWSANVSCEVTDSCKAQLLDSGNLVLVQGKSKRILWQSFDYLTDTLLPEMKIGMSHRTGLEWKMNSWKSQDDPGTGDYTIKFKRGGVPQVFLYEGSKPLWQANPWPWRTFSDIYNYSFVISEEEMYFSYLMNNVSILMRVMIDHSGITKWQRWDKNDRKWKAFWSITKYLCDIYAQCGAYSKCDPNNSDKFECSCLPGYEPKSPGDWYKRDPSGGCIKKRLGSLSTCNNGEGFMKVGNVKFPNTKIATLVGKNLSLNECGHECLMNCSCSAFANVEEAGKVSRCLAWYGELTDTVDLTDVRFDLHVRVDAKELAEYARRSNAFRKKQVKILILSIASAWLTLFFLAYLWLRKRKKARKNGLENRIFDPVSGSIYYKNTLVALDFEGSNRPPDIIFFYLSTIVTATKSFSQANKLGQGGFGSVYKGQLFNGQEVAVKRLSGNSGQGAEEFKNEVMLIAKLQHKNLVKLLGCCIEGGEQMLIYEYLPNKSLDLFLFDETRRSMLDWTKRFNIITGIARGILYLHEDSRFRIIHRDLKSSNILLDAEMNPKISDFGMARIFKADQIQEKTKRVVGTYGYMSPEYALFGKYSVKSDVFSFGVILLEIISGRKSNDVKLVESSYCLIEHVWQLWCKGNIMDIVDPTLKAGSYSPSEVLRCIQIGLLCVQENANDRTTMSEVVLMLSSEKSLPSPNQPAFVFSNSLRAEEGSGSRNEVTITEFLGR